MGFIGRHDRLLLAGLATALIVVFARPIRYLLDLAADVERSSGLALVPGLLILTVVFIIHQHGRRQEAKALAAASEQNAIHAQERAAEMERLVNFGQALGRSLDLEAIRDAVLQHLPKLAGTDDVWVMMRTGGHWHGLVGPALSDQSDAGKLKDATRDRQRDLTRQREAIADSAYVGDGRWKTQPVATDGEICLKLSAGGEVVGVLGIPDTSGPLTEARQRVLATSAALLAISLRNSELFRDLRENSLRDGLTGCFNRTHALEVIDTELRRARRSQSPIAMIMFDLDHFKDINDRYGHLCGDAVLAAVGSKMRDVLRGSDLKCRFGGEEFLVLLPETPLEGAKRVADTMRRELADMTVPWKGDKVSVTASFGVAVALPSEIDSHALIARADSALYRAKDQGRNCVRLAADTVVA